MFMLKFSAFLVLLSQHSFSLRLSKARQREGIRPQHILSATATEPHVPNELILRQVALLVNLWNKVANPGSSDSTHDFPLNQYGLNRNQIKGFIDHFQNCKDCAADGAFLMATQDEENNDVLQLNSMEFKMFSEEEDGEEWGLFDKSLIGGDESYNAEELQPVFPIEKDDEIVLNDTKEWVRKVIADFGVCPFTMDPERAGIPMGGVRYRVSRAKTVEEAFLSYWEEVAALLLATEKEMSTVLLVFPELELFGNYELFEAYCESLSDALCASTICLESEITLVFFHPKFQFRDGNMRSGADDLSAGNFARRSPWPIINILRAPQVKAAQRGVPTGQVYIQNERRLASVGSLKLEQMLRARSWAELNLKPADTDITHESVRKALSDVMVEETYTSSAAIPMVMKSSQPPQMDTEGQSARAVDTGKCPVLHGFGSSSSPSSSIEGETHIQEAREGSALSEEVGTRKEYFLHLADQVDEWLQQLDDEDLLNQQNERK